MPITGLPSKVAYFPTSFAWIVADPLSGNRVILQSVSKRPVMAVACRYPDWVIGLANVVGIARGIETAAHCPSGR